MEDGLSPFALLTVMPQELCASVEKAQSIQTAQWLNNVGFKLSKHSYIP